MPRPEDLLEQMRISKSGWSANDLHRLYEGYGFNSREGSKHTIYNHPSYPILRATVARHNKIAVGYIQKAVKIIDKLKELEASSANK